MGEVLKEELRHSRQYRNIGAMRICWDETSHRMEEEKLLI